VLYIENKIILEYLNKRCNNYTLMALNDRLIPLVSSTRQLLGEMGADTMMLDALIAADEHLSAGARKIFTTAEENEQIADHAKELIIDSTVLPGVLPEKLTSVLSEIISHDPSVTGIELAQIFSPIMGEVRPGFVKRESGLIVPKQTNESLGSEFLVSFGLLNAAGLLCVEEESVKDVRSR